MDKVVRLVLEHAERYPDEGLGVITMGQRHADRIDMAILKARSNQPDSPGSSLTSGARGSDFSSRAWRTSKVMNVTPLS